MVIGARTPWFQFRNVQISAAVIQGTPRVTLENGNRVLPGRDAYELFEHPMEVTWREACLIGKFPQCWFGPSCYLCLDGFTCPLNHLGLGINR